MPSGRLPQQLMQLPLLPQGPVQQTSGSSAEPCPGDASVLGGGTPCAAGCGVGEGPGQATHNMAAVTSLAGIHIQ
jgi:hypothetical protein